MQTPGNDEPGQDADDGIPPAHRPDTPRPPAGPVGPADARPLSPADAPRPATGPTTGGIPTGEPTDASSPPRPEPEPVSVGDPTGGATSTASIEASGPAVPREPQGGGALSGDWPVQATDAIVNVVGAVRDRTTGPITTVARAVVFGLLAGVLGIAVAILFVIAAIRLLDQVLPSGVWAAYTVLGAIFVVLGALVFARRKPRNTAHP